MRARPVFISGGATKGDGWADAKGMFLAGVPGAGPVYSLLGKRDMGTTEFPPMETPLMDGDIAFRQRAGGHTPAPNWPTFIAFAEPVSACAGHCAGWNGTRLRRLAAQLTEREAAIRTIST